MKSRARWTPRLVGAVAFAAASPRPRRPRRRHAPSSGASDTLSHVVRLPGIEVNTARVPIARRSPAR